MSLWNEITSQTEVLAASDQALRERSREVAKWFHAIDPTYVVIAARGTSDNAARYAQYLWGARNRLNVALAAPSLFGVYQSPPDLDGALVVGISQSGESPDLLAVMAEARRQGRPTLAITNNPESPMAQSSDVSIDLGAGPETAVAATKTYTTQLLTVARLSTALAGDLEMEAEFESLPSLVEDVLASSDDIRRPAEAIKGFDRCVVVGRGFHHATAFEWGLKTAELSYLVAQPFSAADFRHGPMALIEPDLPVLAVATAGPVYGEMVELLSEIRDRGGMVVSITDQPDCPADHLITIPPTTEWLSPIPAIIAAQLFTYHLTLARGLDPDQPRGLQKVTKTK